MNEPIFYATGLDPIADKFDKNAARADHMAEASTTQRDRALYAKEASTWREAAEFLRATALTNPAASCPDRQPSR